MSQSEGLDSAHHTEPHHNPDASAGFVRSQTGVAVSLDVESDIGDGPGLRQTGCIDSQVGGLAGAGTAAS